MEKIIYIANAYSLQMVDDLVEELGFIDCRIQKCDGFPKDAKSVVGYADTARILGVECNRVAITLNKGDELYVAQVTGQRLPEGCTELPEGCKLKFRKVTIL